MLLVAISMEYLPWYNEALLVDNLSCKWAVWFQSSGLWANHYFALFYLYDDLYDCSMLLFLLRTSVCDVCFNY